ncbi:uncharacterized protein LOC120671040 [Panicum virgatum]|uniref:uncharacterized protein LOC120671040 n=1 Tax=Panicum virgatum TaxID=38727 RepID=UPI0019D69692|nr:uncharacterized protein LOC120671040 [Panicum virgatum]
MGAATTPSSIDGSSGGGFPSSSPAEVASPSPAWFDVAGSDPSSPGSWDKDPRPSGGFMGYFRNQPHNLHMAGAPIYNSSLNRPLSNNDNDNDNEVEIIIDVSQKYCNSVALICAPYISIN